MASIQYYNKAEVYVGQERVGAALDLRIEVKPPTRATFEATATPLPERWPKVGRVTPDSFGRECQGVLPDVNGGKPLPKPARVEKWQRWRDGDGEWVVVAASRMSPVLRKGMTCCAVNIGAFERTDFHFLGYAKPDKVEVGQRWRWPTREYVVDSVTTHTEQSERVVYLRCESRRVIPMPLVVFFEEPTAMGWEYLGMAESAELDARTATGEALDREAKRNEFVRSDGDTDERLRARFSVPRDPKIEARRANEEAAKRLIANPPEWAYPRAWTCAVLAEVERSRGVAYQLNCYRKTGAATLAIKDYHFARLAGKTHEAAMLCVELNHHIVEVYARGMVKPAGLMGRPGVKGGISTCDLGVDYE